MPSPIRVRQIVEPDGAARRRCIHETQLADVDAHVRVRSAGRIEEYEVARCDLVGFDRLAAAAHIGCRSRQVDIGRAAHYISHQAAAIESAIGRVAAPTIGDADEAHGFDRNLFPANAVIDEPRRARRHGPQRVLAVGAATRARTLWRCTGACRQREHDENDKPRSQHGVIAPAPWHQKRIDEQDE